MTTQSRLATTPNAPFAVLSNEIHAFLAPFQATIYERLRDAILKTETRAFLFPLVETDYDIDFFVSLRVIPAHGSEAAVIQLYTGQKNAVLLEDLKLAQLNDLAWQLSKTYLGTAKVTATTTHNSKKIGYSETVHPDVNDAYSFIIEQLEAFEDNEEGYPYLRAEWSGINVAVQYGKSGHQYRRVKFEIEPELGVYQPCFTVACPHTLSTREILDSIPESLIQTPDSLLWSMQRTAGN